MNGKTSRKAESLGYSALQTADHFGMADPFLPLVSAADVTTTLRVGPLVINNALHNPGLLARQAATVDMLTDGRLELGLGAGYAQAEHDILGIPLPEPRERIDRLEEALRVIVDLLEGRASSVVACVQKPRPPILIGGFRPRILRLASAARRDRAADRSHARRIGRGDGRRRDMGRRGCAGAQGRARSPEIATPSSRCSCSASRSTTWRLRSR